MCPVGMGEGKSGSGPGDDRHGDSSGVGLLVSAKQDMQLHVYTDIIIACSA